MSAACQPPPEIEDSYTFFFFKEKLFFLFPSLSDSRTELREKSLAPGLPGLPQAGRAGSGVILHLLFLLLIFLIFIFPPPPPLPSPPGPRHCRALWRPRPAPRKSSSAQIQRRANPAHLWHGAVQRSLRCGTRETSGKNYLVAMSQIKNNFNTSSARHSKRFAMEAARSDVFMPSRWESRLICFV